MKRFAFTLVALIASITAGFAQNYRPSNPDQPNGYHASEAASHYHGDTHLPAQPQNGYHASEARSHYGGDKYEPSSGWNSSSSGGRWGGEQQQSSGWGSRWNNQDRSSSAWGSRWSNQDQNSSWGQTTPGEQQFARGVLRRVAERRMQEEGNAPATVVGQPDPGVRYSATGTGGILDNRMNNAESSVSRMIRNGGGFDHIYANGN